MLKGICSDAGQTNVLIQGTTYFLFPAGPSHFYVSKFPSINSHRGCFRKSLFDDLEEFIPESEENAPLELNLVEGEIVQLSLF